MSHTLNAINYLFLGDTEGSQVELRKAEEYQVLHRGRHQHKNLNSNKSAIVSKETHSRSDSKSTDSNEVILANKYREVFDYAKETRNSFDNAFTYYLASQVYLAQGERGIDDALVSIKMAYQLNPLVPDIQTAYIEIARAHSQSAYDKAKKELQIGDDKYPTNNVHTTGSVFVCFEAGSVPRLESVKIPFVISDKLYPIAFPTYNRFNLVQEPLIIRTSTDTIKTTTVADIRCLAIKSLQERMPEIVGRNLVGAIFKAGIQHEAQKNGGAFAGLVAGIVSLAATSADCRSWLSLPAEIQIAKFNLSTGSNTIILQGYDWNEAVTLDIKAGSSNIILVRSLLGFRRIDVKAF